MCPNQFNQRNALPAPTATDGRATRRYMRWIRSPLREMVQVRNTYRFTISIVRTVS
jgi:hypothetical protein